MVNYPDTSFLVSLYIDETSSHLAQEFMDISKASLAFTPFHRLEVRTALRLRVFRRDISLVELQSVFRQIDGHVADEILQHTPLNWSDALREAERISEAFLAKVGARSGDLLHVASAIVLGAKEFLTFDQRQNELARKAGLKVKQWRNR